MFNSRSDATVTNCTFSANTALDGGGIYNDLNMLVLANSILWSNDAGEVVHDGGGSTSVTYCDVQGGHAGEGNIDADPLFVDAPNGNCRLATGSPCIDAADNTAVPPAVTTDLDGNPRFVDDPDTADTGNGEAPIVDMGAYEFQIETCPADFNGDGDVDTTDLLYLLGAWGTPDGDVDGDGDTDTADLLALLAAWGECP
jgi:predicted outer membrane repeat protein